MSRDPGIVIRPAEEQDVPAAAELAARLVREHHAFDPLRFMEVEHLEEGYGRYMRSLIGEATAVFLVAIERTDSSERVVGYILAGLEERNWSDLRDACGKIHDVYVDEAARRRGVATRLVQEAVERLAGKGAPRTVLMAAWRNDRARALFERMGFRPTMVEMTRESGPAGA